MSPTATRINPERLKWLEGVSLQRGGHSGPEDGVCANEAVSVLAGEPFGAYPKTESGVIGRFVQSWNDAMNDEDRQMLKPLLPRCVGSAGSPEVERWRSWMALDWSCRVSAPTWLRLAGLAAEAEALDALPPIVDAASVRKAQVALTHARRPAGDAARDAAWDAARAAARDAAGDAAWDAAWAAAWAALRPTVVKLQASALDLVGRMLAAQEVAA